MYKVAVAVLLLATPAISQDSKVDVPQTNLKNTVIPKSGGQQPSDTAPTKVGETAPIDATVARPAKDGPQQASTPNASPPATIQTTSESNQSDTSIQ